MPVMVEFKFALGGGASSSIWVLAVLDCSQNLLGVVSCDNRAGRAMLRHGMRGSKA